MLKYSPPPLSLQPYKPGEQPIDDNLIYKLNTNENPFPPSPTLKVTLSEFDLDDLRKYTDPTSKQLREALAEYHGISSETIFVGNGSDEVLAHAFKALINPNAPVVLNEVTYAYYSSYCRLFEFDTQNVSMEEDLSVDLRKYNSDVRNVVIANPNANTGISLPENDLINLIERSPQAIFIIDEAYVDFSTYSLCRRINKYDNLLVVRTFSKSRALAGLRVGYAIGNERLIKAIQSVKDSFNSYPLNLISEQLAIASLRDENYFQKNVSDVIEIRAALSDLLRRHNFIVIKSDANFVLTKHPKLQSDDLYLSLKSRGILVRKMSHARITDYVRITIPTKEGLHALSIALKNLIDSDDNPCVDPLIETSKSRYEY